MRLTFHGAAGGVTGSCFLVETKGARVLVDCGLFQGNEDDADGRDLNAESFGFAPADIDAVVLTHAHLDHCGRLPLLVKRGFRGEIHATAPTRELARIVLLDAAGLMREEQRRVRGRRGSLGGAGNEPLYDEWDVLDALDQFASPLDYGEARDVATGVRVRLIDAGHILGSASAILEVEGKRIAFSGDVGNANKPLVRNPTHPPACDVAVMETTYGDRNHRPFADSVRELHEAVASTIEARGNVVIPSFALERAQELLFVLREGIESGKLPFNLRVYLDSPMAIAATRLFGRYPDQVDDETRRILEAGRDPLALPGLRLTRDIGTSRGIARHRGGAVIIAGSGMLTGGRVLGHLARELHRTESSVVFVSFASRGTLARKIIDGARDVRIMGREIRVRARVHTINGFSAHAGRDELLAWHAATAATRTFLVHGDDEPRAAIASALSGKRVALPGLHESFEV